MLAHLIAWEQLGNIKCYDIHFTHGCGGCNLWVSKTFVIFELEYRFPNNVFEAPLQFDYFTNKMLYIDTHTDKWLYIESTWCCDGTISIKSAKEILKDWR